MPLYEYLCETCSRVTETLQRLGEAPMTVCPHCGGPVRKLVSAPAFQFKGEGWYVTDYARKAGAGAGKGDAAASESKSSDAPTAAAAPPSADAKPAPAGDAKKGD